MQAKISFMSGNWSAKTVVQSSNEFHRLSQRLPGDILEFSSIQ